jgi:hypothetical protein
MANKKKTLIGQTRDLRKLSGLRSIGPAAIKDFKLLGIDCVEALKDKDSMNLYQQLCNITNTRHDPCVIDVFRAAIEQAKDPQLEPRKKDWWYWSKIRKQSLK